MEQWSKLVTIILVIIVIGVIIYFLVGKLGFGDESAATGLFDVIEGTPELFPTVDSANP